ncbi:hypothetical protein [Streptomyces jumonjinensis]|uniref:hypothetical protein n=1 Tax=Streptomyces jumonjinensis TaxID=1945 RepID=UPI0037AF0F63
MRTLLTGCVLAALTVTALGCAAHPRATGHARTETSPRTTGQVHTEAPPRTTAETVGHTAPPPGSGSGCTPDSRAPKAAPGSAAPRVLPPGGPPARARTGSAADRARTPAARLIRPPGAGPPRTGRVTLTAVCRWLI